MNGAVAKKTQETLGKVIKKPPLTEKLLSKPPFRYLHDIVSEVIRTTGFMKGLYEETEMKSDNVKDKDSKIAFLQKAIDVVMLVSGEPVTAKPARIVAGHEPEKTNELLQTIAKCCLNKLSSDEAVRHVLAGDKVDLKGKASTSKSQGKENREEKIKENSVNTEQKDPDQPKDEESRRKTEKPRERDRTKDRERDKDKSRDRDREKVPDRGRDQEKEKTRDKDRDRTKDKEREKNRERDSQKERERVRDKDRERERDKRRDRDRARELQKETEDKKKEKGEKKSRTAEEVNKLKPQPEKLNRNHKAASGQTDRDDLDEVPDAEDDKPSEGSPHQPNSSLRIPRPSSAKGQRRRPKSGAPDDSDSDGGENATVDKTVHLENGDASDAVAPHTSHSTTSGRRIPRPSSARPAPPRVRKQESYNDAGPAERLGSANPASAVIIDGKKLSEDEDDEDGQFVVEEAALLSTDLPELEMGLSAEFQGDERHGGLVKKILETKKDYESSPSALTSKDQDRMPMLEAARKKERELVVKEIERLRTSIQSVCRSALPLGKIMDYIQEDMDSMQNELQNWRRENRDHAEALLQEQRITDSAVKPLKAELSELEQLITEQQDKICAIKSNILQNEEKIRKMVSSINIAKT